MDDTYKFEDLEIQLNENTVVYVFGEVTYEAHWDCGDFDYNGPQGTATHRVGWELSDIDYIDIKIESFHSMTKAGKYTRKDGKVVDNWVDIGVVDTEDSEVEIDKDLLPFLKEKIKESKELDELICSQAQEHGTGEPDYD